MRILSLLSILVLSSFGVLSQNTFQRVYGGESYDVGKAIIQTADDGYLIAGATGSFGVESGQIMLIKTDVEGYVEWRKYYGGDYADQAEAMVQDLDGNFLIGGFSERENLSYQAYALKVDADGDTIWTRQFGGSEWDFVREVLALSDGGYALFGQTYSYGEGDGDFYLLRLSSDGDTLWTKTYGGPLLESGESISLTNEGGFYLTGFTESFGTGKKDVYIVKTDAVGDTLWTRTYGFDEDDQAYGSCTTNDGGIVAVGTSYTPEEGNFMMLKFDENGVFDWDRVEDGSTDESWFDVIENSAGSLIVAGYVADSDFGKEDVRIMRVTSQGNFDGMAASRGSPQNDRGYDIKETSDNAYVIVGVTGGFLNRFDDVYLLKTDLIGETGSPELGLNEIVIDGVDFAVTIGPNPIVESTPSLYIENYQEVVSKLNDPVNLRLFDNVGKVVYQMPVSSGVTPLLDIELSKGIYFFQLTSGEIILATGKLVSLR